MKQLPRFTAERRLAQKMNRREKRKTHTPTRVERKTITLQDGSAHEVEVTVCATRRAEGYFAQPFGRISNKGTP